MQCFCGDKIPSFVIHSSRALHFHAPIIIDNESHIVDVQPIETFC